MNILITSPSLNPQKNVSGVSTVVNTIIKANVGQQYFHYLLGRPDKPMGKFKWLVALFAQLINFPFFVEKNKIQIVHQNLPFNGRGLLRESIINYWCYLLKIPVVLHLHGGEFLMKKDIGFFYKFLAKTIFNHSREIIVLSEIEKESLKLNHHVVNSTILLNSIDVNTFKFKQRNYDSKPTFLFMGRIHESKGVNDIVIALKLLKEHRSFKFCLCGTGPLKDYFISECSAILGEDFEYKGIVSGIAKHKVLDIADFFLLPSRYGEGLPMALLEAMACGLIPVVTDDASMKYIIQDCQNGIMVNKSEPTNLYQEMMSVMDRPDLCKTISVNARNTIELGYDIKNYVDKLNKIYNCVLET